jgi:mRNA-degrading endonuclease toxin of MazEF toxin-antitoxin module
MQYGDVVRVQLPRPQGKAGREQYGVRPAIVVQVDKSHTNLSTIIVVPLTSNLAASGFAGSFSVAPDGSNGLTVTSIVLTHQVRAIDKSRIETVIGSLGNSDFQRLQTELRALLGL